MYFIRIGIALSVLLNVILGGSSNQTFSARNYHWKRQGKINFVREIDFLSNLISKTIKIIFKVNIDLTNHCMTSWSYWIIAKNANSSKTYDVVNENLEGKG